MPAGIVFDVVASTPITLQGLAIGGFDETFPVYTKSGTYVGFEESPGAWSLLSSPFVPFSQQEYDNGMWYGRIDLPSLALGPGERIALYIANGLSIEHTGSPGALAASNDDLQIFRGIGFYAPFDTSGYGQYSATGIKLYYESAAAPEPSTFATLALSLVGLGLLARRRGRS